MLLIADKQRKMFMELRQAGMSKQWVEQGFPALGKNLRLVIGCHLN